MLIVWKACSRSTVCFLVPAIATLALQFFSALFVQSWHLSQLTTIFSKWRDSMDSRIQGIEEPELKKKVSRRGFLGFVCVRCMCNMPVHTHGCIQALTHIHVQRSEGSLQELVLCWIYDWDSDLLTNWWFWMDSLLIVALVMLLTRWTSRSPIYTHKPTETLKSLTFKTNSKTAD